MGTTSDKLNGVLLSKNNIKQSIINRGVAIPSDATFASYPNYIKQITGGLQPIINVTASVNNSLISTALTNITAKGSGAIASMNGNPTMVSTVNLLIVSGGELIYMGNAGVPAIGAYIPLARITYIATDNSDFRIGYFAVVNNGSGVATYSTVDSKTGTRITLDSIKTYKILVSPCMLFRSVNTVTIEGSSSFTAATLGLANVNATVTIEPAEYSIVNTVGRTIKTVDFPNMLKGTIQAGGYPYVSVSARSFTGAAANITGYHKGEIVMLSSVITF